MGAADNNPLDVVCIVDLLPFLRIVSATFFSASPVAPASNVSASSSAPTAVVVPAPVSGAVGALSPSVVGSGVVTGVSFTGSFGGSAGGVGGAGGGGGGVTGGGVGVGVDDDPLSFWFCACNASIAAFDLAVRSS